MSRTVYKYTMPHPGEAGEFTLNLPLGWKALSVERQTGRYALWALVTPDNEARSRTFRWHGTGHPVAMAEYWVATVQEPPFVWHLFTVGEQ